MICSLLGRNTPWGCESTGERRGSNLSSTVLAWLMPFLPLKLPKARRVLLAVHWSLHSPGKETIVIYLWLQAMQSHVHKG